ncbi:hypothetical protein N0V95_001852 [Ascochyta clinopodiicola]|nr:hypothetical protein N0V95_001852 [Ascochyta clinopodiicola]
MAPRDGDGAREIQRKRDRQGRRLEAVVPHIPCPAVLLGHPTRLVDRMTHDHGEVQHGRGVQDCMTRDEDFSGDGGPVQSVSRNHDHQGRAIRTNSEDANNDMNVDNSTNDTFTPNTVLTPTASSPRATYQPVNTKLVQNSSPHHLTFNPHLHSPRPVQPATRPEPIRLLNSRTPQEPAISFKALSATELPVTATPKTTARPKHPVNPYKGKDIVKRLVQNKKLQLLLSDRPMPRPRKAADRMVLKCAGRKEMR